MNGQARAKRSLDATAAAKAIQRLISQSKTERDLGFYFRVGTVIASIEDGYGRNAHKTVAGELATLGITTGFGRASLHDMERLAKVFSEEEVTKMSDAGVGWRAATALGRDKLTDRQRRSMIRRVQNKSLKAGDLGQLIEQKGHRKSRINTRTIDAAGERAQKAIEILHAVMAKPDVDRLIRQRAEQKLRQIQKQIEVATKGRVCKSA